MSKNAAARRPELYNPVLVAALSLLFTPAFGAQLQAINWAVLGETALVRNSRMWVRTTIWMILLFVVLQTMLRDEPLMANFGGVYFLLVMWAAWMVTSGYRQITYVKDLCGADYIKKPLGRPIILAAGGWIIYTMISLTVGMAFALAGWDQRTPDPTESGVVIRVPEGQKEAVIEPLPAAPKADSTAKQP